MNRAITKHNIVSLFIQASYLAFFISFIFSFRAITSISIAAIFMGGIIENRTNTRSFLTGLIRHPFLIACAFFYLLQFVSLLYTTDTEAGWNNIRLKSGLVFIPLALYSTGYMDAAIKKRLLSWYCIIVAAASLYCLAIAFRQYTAFHDRYVFFYHFLVLPIRQHGVYFSIFVVVSLIHLLDRLRKKDFIWHRSFHLFLALFLSLFLLLLSSKLVIVFYAICLIYYLVLLLKKKPAHRNLVLALLIIIVAGGTTLLLTENPVSERFRDIFHGDIGFVAQEKFNKADYFNGVQFRLLQWRLTGEILTENHSWIKGVSAGDAQSLLNEQYISKNMYTGEPAEQGRRGYLEYNSHNQLLQSLLQNGIVGAIAFLLITGSLVWMVWKNKNAAYMAIVVLLVIYSLIESVFETQYGILLNTFFPLFLNNSREGAKDAKDVKN